ncbi:MAG: D-alanyl-D-alanine carboxypeptidase [Hyphomicrobiaceae bacterium]|nr:D-alanyl-D-alanine carboxypeptidase [Hyphomicrobiaceae bacterium]
MQAVACTLALAVSPTVSHAADKQASFVIDGNTGAVLHAQQENEPRYPASLTKMMTIYMAFEEMKAGRMSEDTMLTISVNAASMAPSKLGLDVGERISLGNAIKAVVTKSANDIACAIAEAISGSEAEFARRMTKRARDIGMASTTFRNASGLPDPRQLTTARDMVTLGLRLRDDFPDRFSVFQLRSFSYGGKTYRNHNTLMNGFGGMDGIKTGYTRASGFNLVSSVQRDGKYVVGSVFGGASAGVRNAHMRVVLFRALGNASTEKTRKSGPVLIARSKPARAPEPPAPLPAKAPVVQAAAAPVIAKKPDKKAKAEAKAQALSTAMAPPPVPQPVATSDQPPAADPAIRIAKVKAVMVAAQTAGAPAPGAGSAAPAAQPPPQRQPPQFVSASATPRLDLGSRAAPSPGAPAVPAPAARSAEANESVVLKARRPGTLDDQIAALSAPPAQPERLGMRPAQAGPEVDPQRDIGEQQPRALMGTQAATPPSRQAKPAAPVARAGGNYLIQVGAFASAAEAKRHLESVRGRADVLRNRPSLAEQAQVGSKQVYRARFAEFDSAGATAACTTLRQQKVDCMVLKGQ